MSYNCPICGSGGLPNYKTTKVNCPQCDTDLCSFMNLHKAKRRTKLIKVWSWIILLIAFITTVIIVSFISDNNTERSYEMEKTIEDQKISIESKESEIKSLLDTLSEIRYSVEQDSIIIQYKIQYGDNLSKISYSIYGDYKKYDKIIELNQLQEPYIIYPGQILKIKTEGK